MENQIFEVGAGISKSMVLKDDEIWFSQDKVRNLEKFEKAINKTGMLQSAYKVPLSKISEVSYNEASESAKIKYLNDKGKEKKLNIGFGDTAISNQFGKHLGEKLGLNQSSTQEGQLKPLLLNALYLAFAIGGTFLFGMMDDTSQITDSSRRKGSGARAIMKLVIDTIGQTGVFIVGGLISLYFAYQLYKRFKNPSNEILYSK